MILGVPSVWCYYVDSSDLLMFIHGSNCREREQLHSYIGFKGSFNTIAPPHYITFSTTVVPVKLQTSLKIGRNVVAVVYSRFQSSWSRKNVHKDRDNIRQLYSDLQMTTTQRLISIFTERDVLIRENYRLKRAKCRQNRNPVAEKCFSSPIPKTWSKYDHHNGNYKENKT